MIYRDLHIALEKFILYVFVYAFRGAQLELRLLISLLCCDGLVLLVRIESLAETGAQSVRWRVPWPGQWRVVMSAR